MKLIGYIACSCLILACSGPRNIIHSGKVTEKGKFSLGGNGSYNFSMATLSAMSDALKSQISDIVNKDTAYVDQSFNEQIKPLIVYSLDPLAASFELFARYGIFNNMDVGYNWASGTHVFDTRYQFMRAGNFDGSLGFQFSMQSYELPSFLGSLQSYLQYELKRRDFLIPLTFSKPLGHQEKYGALGFGLVYGRSFIKYDFNPNSLYQLVSGQVEEINYIPRGSNSYNTYGCFFNLKLGFQYVYLLTGLSSYYQNYGKYNLFLGEQKSFSGITLVPNMGIQFNF